MFKNKSGNLLIGFLFILCALLINVYTIGEIVNIDNLVKTTVINSIIWTFDILLLLYGYFDVMSIINASSMRNFYAIKQNIALQVCKNFSPKRCKSDNIAEEVLYKLSIDDRRYQSIRSEFP